MCRPRVTHLILCYSLLGVGLGIAGFFVFFHLENIDAGLWALASAVFAAVAFHLHYLNHRRTLDSWHDTDTLQGIQFLGLLVATVGAAGTAWYIFCAMYYDIPILPVKHSPYIAAIWTFKTAKWGLTLLVSVEIYTNVIRRENPRLVAIS